MTTLFRPFFAAVALLALFLSGCGSPTGGHNDADVAFATDMVPHHRQAVQMSDVLLGKSGVDSDVLALATKIKAEQAPEIEQMTGWLSSWGASAESGDTGMEGMGGGMMSPSDMEALRSAEGRAAQTLFLQGMVRHHEGAVAMARTEVEQGQNARAKALATSIVTSQQAEIEQMGRLLGG